MQALLLPGLGVGEARYRIEAPSSLGLAVDVDEMRRTRRSTDGTDVWEIEGARDGRFTLEPAVADAWLQMPRVLASTFGDTAALAAAYAFAVDAKASPTDTTRAAAVAGCDAVRPPQPPSAAISRETSGIPDSSSTISDTPRVLALFDA
jgi:hypothetical protein